jgi:hypothetical protein
MKKFSKDFSFQFKKAVLSECFKDLKLEPTFKDYRKFRCDPKMKEQVSIHFIYLFFIKKKKILTNDFNPSLVY